MDDGNTVHTIINNKATEITNILLESANHDQKKLGKAVTSIHKNDIAILMKPITGRNNLNYKDGFSVFQVRGCRHFLGGVHPHLKGGHPPHTPENPSTTIYTIQDTLIHKIATIAHQLNTLKKISKTTKTKLQHTYCVTAQHFRKPDKKYIKTQVYPSMI